MKSLTLAAVAAAVLALAACGGHATAAPPAASPSRTPSPAATVTAAALTCKQQGAQWKAANRHTIRNFKNALTPFQDGTVTSAQARAGQRLPRVRRRHLRPASSHRSVRAVRRPTF